jgi:hypothetical protein
VTLTAELLQGGTELGNATGSVTFSVSGTTLGSSPLNGGTATLVTAVLPTGADTVKAVYSGDADYNPATGTVVVTVAPVAPALTMTASSSTLSLVPGATGTVVFTLASNQTFGGTISFACSGAPQESSCTVNPSSLTLGPGQTSTVAVVLATTAQNNEYQASNHSVFTLATGGVSTAGLLLFVFPRRRRISGVVGMIVIAALSVGSIAVLTGCNNNKYSGTPAGTSNLTVTATSGSISLTQSIAVTIGQAQAQ